MSVRVSCPSCGGPVVFEVGASMVAVCPYCRSAVARGDRAVEDLGKVAALIDTGAILKVGLEGKYDGRKFRLTGRTQLGHAAGGVWDEWYAAFPDGEWGWLSEAQGRFYMLFEQGEGDRPDLVDLDPGEEVPIPESRRRFVVAETGTATVKGAEGELPFRIVPDSVYPYADLSGTKRGFATLDYSQDPPTLYLGREVTLDDLGVRGTGRRETFEMREVAAKRINCPNCAGPLDLQAPDRTERVGCPYCGSMLDATRGNLTLLEALKAAPFKLHIPLGTKGKFGDAERTLIGALKRSVTVEGKDYFWKEYLLYHPRDGFEWLVCGDGHWTRVKGIPAADVREGNSSAEYDGRSFRKFQAGLATVRGVVGECYWKVEVGEEAQTADFIHPPELLSVERSWNAMAQEVNWSTGSYLTPAAVQQAFGLKEPLPRPTGVAPNQVFPYWRVYTYAAYLFVALCVLGIVVLFTSPSRTVYEKTYQLRAAPPPGVPPEPQPDPPPGMPEFPAPTGNTQVFFSDYFELKGGRNVRVSVECPDFQGWLVVEGDLVQKKDGQVQPFLVPLTYYAGVEDGEKWTEGSHAETKYIAGQPPGEYSMRLEVERENATAPTTLKVKVEEGTPRARTWFLAFLGIMAVPVGVGIYHVVFLSKKWENADFSMFATDTGTPARNLPRAVPVRRKKGAKGKKKRRPARDDAE